MTQDTLTFYRSGLLQKKWRWRYQAAGNGENLANGSQGYSDPDWALRSAFRVCGLGNPFDHVTNKQRDEIVEREDGSQVYVRFR